MSYSGPVDAVMAVQILVRVVHSELSIEVSAKREVRDSRLPASGQSVPDRMEPSSGSPHHGHCAAYN